MNLRKFVAPSTRDCLRQLREALGEDALIISTRKVAQGIEVIGACASDIDAVQTHVPAALQPMTPALPASSQRKGRIAPHLSAFIDSDEDTDVKLSPTAHYLSERQTSSPERAVSSRLPEIVSTHTVTTETVLPRPNFAERIAAVTASDPSTTLGSAAEGVLPEWLQQVRQQREQRERTDQSTAVSATTATANIKARSATSVANEAENSSQLIQEFQGLKRWMQKEVASLCWRDATQGHPAARLVWQRLVESGFSPALARSAITLVPENMAEQQTDAWVKELIVKNLVVRNSHDELIEQGGVVALVGPTGVGKTTTVAKIAARCVAKYGIESLGLITTDQYRIGAVDQLRTYGRLLGIEVYAARDRQDLETMLKCMTSRRLVLIDTVGISQKDAKLAQQLDMLSLERIQRVLVMTAASACDQCEEIYEGYKQGGLKGLIASKLDEAVRIGGPLDLAMRQRLSLQYVTSGQRVPEDLHLANGAMLIHRALKARPRSLNELNAAEIDWAAVPSL